MFIYLTLQFFSCVHAHLQPEGANAEGGATKRERMWASLARLSGAGAATMKVLGPVAASNDPNGTFAPALVALTGVSESFAHLMRAAAEDVAAKKGQPGHPTTAEEARKELAKLFSEPGSASLLVVMDDFDRQTSEEIQTLIRLIKANANFSGLNYLILCDPKHLARALDPIAAGRGEEFLEKIVQNPIRLPQMDCDSVLRQLAVGLTKVAERTGYPVEQHQARFEVYFNNFLRFRLTSLRSVYRLLEALDFSASALTRDGHLEVDLVDLLAVDFLRLYLPDLADWLQGFNPALNVFAGLNSVFGKERKQSFAEVLPSTVIELFGAERSYAVARTLFPELTQGFPADEEKFQRLFSMRDVTVRNYPLAISDEEHFNTYFRLLPGAHKVPEAAYRAARVGESGRAELCKHLSYWISERWLPSSLRRLRAESKTLPPVQRRNLFLAFADCSDALGAIEEPESFEDELRSTLRFMESLLESLLQTEREDLLDQLFASAGALTAKLLFLESLRIRHSPESWKDREPDMELPVLATERINDLQVLLAGQASLEIRSRSYLEHPRQGFRLWRWANAVGTEYTEEFLRGCLQHGNLELTCTVLRAVARSIVGKYDMSFEDPIAYKTSTSQGLLTTLLRFASAGFWLDFVAALTERFPSTETPAEGDDCLMQHLRRGLSKLAEISSPTVPSP